LEVGSVQEGTALKTDLKGAENLKVNEDLKYYREVPERKCIT